MNYVVLFGRILFASIFILKPLEHFSKGLMDHASTMGVPLTSLLVPLAGIVGLLGGLSILLGYKAKIGAWLVVAFLIPTTFFMHRFWEAGDVIPAMMQEYCFLKNMSLLGAALMITHFGSGPFSLSKD